MMITPWDRLEHVGAYHYPWLPVKWLLRDRYDSARNLDGFRRPVIVVVAEQDGVVPARFGHALFESLQQPKSLRVLAGAGHNDWVGHVDQTWWDDAIGRLLQGGADEDPALRPRSGQLSPEGKPPEGRPPEGRPR
jgi:pimeloyl-ACP methyl ester carboxylesterase